MSIVRRHLLSLHCSLPAVPWLWLRAKPVWVSFRRMRSRAGFGMQMAGFARRLQAVQTKYFLSLQALHPKLNHRHKIYPKQDALKGNDVSRY